MILRHLFQLLLLLAGAVFVAASIRLGEMAPRATGAAMGIMALLLLGYLARAGKE